MFDDIEEIIMNIEMKIFEQTKNWNCKLKLETNGFYRKISFLDIEIWNSEDDILDFFHKGENKLELFKLNLRKKIMNEIEILKKINLI